MNKLDKNLFTEKYVNELYASLPPPNRSLTPNKNNENYFYDSILLATKNTWLCARDYIHTMFNSQESKLQALKLVIAYTNDNDCHEALKGCHNTIIEIYKRLQQLSRGYGTWADEIDDEIDKELLFGGKENCQSEGSHNNAFSERPVSKNEKIDEDQIFDALAAPLAQLPQQQPDSKAASHIFTRLTGIPSLNNEYLFNIHADEFGLNSKLEGGDSRQTVEYLSSYLNAQKPSWCPSEVLDELTNGLDVRAQSQEESIQTIQKAWSRQTPLLIVDGGWVGRPSGHAIYYEIIPDPDQKSATFRLYNMGSGVDNHEMSFEGYKIKCRTYCDWKGIDKDKLTSPLFLEALVELNKYETLPQSEILTNYDSKDIYTGLKALLQPKEEQLGPNTKVLMGENQKHMMSPQRSGTCAWRSLMTFLRTKVQLCDYKRFKCDIKLQSLADYVEGYKGEITPADWRLVKKSHQKLCRSILRLHSRGIVADAYLLSAEEALEPIADWIHSHKECRSIRTADPVTLSYEKCAEGNLLYNAHSLPSPLYALSQAPQSDTMVATESVDIYQFEDFKKILSAPLSPETIGERLGELNILAQKTWLAHADIPTYKGILDCVGSLPMEEAFWQLAIEKAAGKAETLITQMGMLSEQFLKCCFTLPDADILFPEKVYVFYKIIYLQQMLYRLTHSTSLTLFQINKKVPFFYTLKSDATVAFPQWDFLQFSSSKMKKEIDIIFNTSDKKFEFLLCFSKVFFPNGWPSLDLELSFNSNSVPLFATLIRKEFPDILKAISQKNCGFAQAPPLEQDAIIICSDLLPDWMKAIRHPFIAVNYLRNCSVTLLTTLDRKEDLKPIFPVQKMSNETSATITGQLSGITTDILCQPKMKKQATFRYAQQYRGWDSSLFAQLFFSEYYNSEKALIVADLKKNLVTMPAEEFQELARLFTNRKLLLVETLEYFTKHPNKIKDVEYQSLLSKALFTDNLLEKELTIPGFTEQLARFITNNYERAQENNDMQCAVYFLKLAHQLQEFCPTQTFFCCTSDKLKVLAASDSVDVDSKSLIYAELIAQLGQQKELTEDEVVMLITGYLYISANQVNSKYKEDPLTAKQVREAVVMHSAAIERVLFKAGAPNQMVLNRLLHTLHPEIKEDKNS